LKLPTIYSHIAKLYGDGKAINIYDFISKNDVEAIHQAKIELNDSNSLKEYYEFYNEQMDYFKIRLALSVIEKEAL
jgi:ATP-dependent DNA helicase RecQ